MSAINFTFAKPSYTFQYHFRKQAKDKPQLAGKEYTVVDPATGAVKRNSESFEYIPEPQTVEVSPAVLETLITELVKDNIRSVVDNGDTPKNEEINIAAILKEYVEGSPDVRKFPKEFRAACAKVFAEYLRAQGRKEAGIVVQHDLLAGGFNANSASKVLNGLASISNNLLTWITEGATDEQKAEYAEYITAMIEKIEVILNPTDPVVKVEDLGLDG